MYKFTYYIDPPLTVYRSSSPKTTLQEAKEWLLSETRDKDSKVENFAILLKPQTSEGQGKLKMIGKVGAFMLQNECSWMLHPDYWGKGYATEALRGWLWWFWNQNRKSDQSFDFLCEWED
jgi:RimJ/RimL family protein N-acetyltransferase